MPMIDAEVTNFDKGVSNRLQGDHIRGSMKTLDPTRFHQYYEQFDYFTAADWTITEVGVATQALANVDGGALLITNAAADNDSSFQNKVGESFLPELGKQLHFAMRFAVNDATQSDVLAGIQITDATPVDASDGIFFLKADGAATVNLISRKNGVDVILASVATLADDVFVELSFFWDGISAIWAGVNGAPVARMEPGASLPDDEVLTVSFGIQNGEAAAKTMTVDYVFISEER